MKDRIDQEEHDIAVQQIARIRFPFPDDERPSWKTYTNHPEEQMGIETGDGIIYSDIVVVNTDGNFVVMIGEIETEDSVDEVEMEQWKEYSEICKIMYLYVPAGYCKDVIQLCEDNSINITGFRYYYRSGDGFYVLNCKEG